MANTPSMKPISGTPPHTVHVVAASDRSELGDRAVFEALRLCSLYQSSMLHVVGVADDRVVGVRLPGELQVQTTPEAEESMRAHVAKLVDQYVTAGGPIAMEKIAVYVTMGSPAERITSIAASIDAEVIVVATHGRHGLQRLLHRSVAEEVVRKAPCTVFVVRPPDFLDGEKLPEVEPPLQAGEHSLQPFRHHPTYHYVNRHSRPRQSIMPAI
jgi:nucleotide-binding universal stress UspA family protein